ncbi:hypothetical protein Glove_148g2 [Diversispora epigaea]|uniref:Uncharacterized protein n=1 Tax=Diversispora epigaea TaxID=1348612 RepID=A0A397ITT5_9GLOM|nr:hypothetical protein Glove_148g2 [Diversispora epigaea]
MTIVNRYFNIFTNIKYDCEMEKSHMRSQDNETTPNQITFFSEGGKTIMVMMVTGDEEEEKEDDDDDNNSMKNDHLFLIIHYLELELYHHQHREEHILALDELSGDCYLCTRMKDEECCTRMKDTVRE